MSKILLVLILSLSSIHTFADQDDVFIRCAHKENDEERLSCYDKFARTLSETIHASDSLTQTTVTESTSSTEEYEINSHTKSKDDSWTLAKLEADDPNFFGFSGQAGNKEIGAEDHIEFDISLRYPLIKWSKGRVYAIYNGGYDFQALTESDAYESSPIISKTQNPGAVVEWDWVDGHSKSRLGVFHHSNGQSLNAGDNPLELARSVAEFSNIETLYRTTPALEQVSRSSNYLQYRYQWTSNPDGDIDSNWEQYQFELRHIYSTDDEIFWPIVPDVQPRLQDFDGIRVVGEKMIALNELIHPLLPRALFRAELQTGIESTFENVGGEISLGFNFKSLFGLVDTKNLMISGYYYNGFAKDISTYHIRTKHWGVGLNIR